MNSVLSKYFQYLLDQAKPRIWICETWTAQWSSDPVHLWFSRSDFPNFQSKSYSDGGGQWILLLIFWKLNKFASSLPTKYSFSPWSGVLERVIWAKNRLRSPILTTARSLEGVKKGGFCFEEKLLYCKQDRKRWRQPLKACLMSVPPATTTTTPPPVIPVWDPCQQHLPAKKASHISRSLVNIEGNFFGLSDLQIYLCIQRCWGWAPGWSFTRVSQPNCPFLI